MPTPKAHGVVRLAGRSPILEAVPPRDLLRGSAVLDLSDLRFATPLDLVGLASLATSASSNTPIHIVPPSSPDVANYLLRMDLGAAFPIGSFASFASFAPETPRDHDAPVIEVVRLARPADVELESGRIWARLERVLAPSTCLQIIRILGELLDNACTHGSSPAGAFLAGQYYTGKTSGMPPGFWVAVADSGIGIRRHLSVGGRFAGTDDVEAIRRAVQPGVSGTEDPNRGVGLRSVRHETGRVAPGRVLIRSGSGEGLFFQGPAGGTARYGRLPERVGGTWVLALAGTDDPS